MITEAVVICGTTPVDTEIDGDREPVINSFPVPLLSVPMPTWVIVAVPAEQVPNEMVATGETEFPVTVQPPDVRATATRAYPV